MDDIGDIIGIPLPPPNRYCDSVPSELKPKFGFIYLLLVLLVIVIIIVLIVYEYKDHDCITGKACYHRIEPPTFNDENNIVEYINGVQDMIQQGYNPVIWRMALIVALIIALPVIYFIQGRWPTPIEYIVVVIIIFLAVYFSYGWLWAHFYQPNIKYVQDTLNNLQNNLS